jgi:hypothetical protein
MHLSDFTTSTELLFEVYKTSFLIPYSKSEAESKEHGLWDPMPELTITHLMLPPKSTPTHFPCATLWMPESNLTLCQSRLFPPVKDFGFGLCSKVPLNGVLFLFLFVSVADPGSGAFLTLGSGIGFFRIPDPKPIFLRTC